MKFGKHIRSVAHVPWADRYVDYKGLKKLLKPLENGNGTPEEEATFLQAMHSEIDKVDSFFTAKEADVFEEFRFFCLKIHKAEAKPTRRKCTTLEQVVQAHEGTEMGSMIKDFIAFASKLETLRRFVMINVLAVIKISKKHDKHSQQPVQERLVEEVHNRHFYKSAKFGTLITDVEVLASQLVGRLTQLDHNNGPSAKQPPPNCPTCSLVLNNPIILPCGHRFCMRCVSPCSYFKKDYKCPICNTELILDLETIRHGSLLAGGALTNDGWLSMRSSTQAQDIVHRHIVPAKSRSKRNETPPMPEGAGSYKSNSSSGEKLPPRIGNGHGHRRSEDLLHKSDLSQMALCMSPYEQSAVSSCFGESDDPKDVGLFPGIHVPSAGLWITAGSGGITVTGVSPGGPAATSCYICRGDVIVAIDLGIDASAGGWSATQLGDHRFVDVRSSSVSNILRLFDYARRGAVGSSKVPVWVWLRRQIGQAKREVVAQIMLAPGRWGVKTWHDVVLSTSDGQRLEVPGSIASSLTIVSHALSHDAEHDHAQAGGMMMDEEVGEVLLPNEGRKARLCTAHLVSLTLAHVDMGYACMAGLCTTVQDDSHLARCVLIASVSEDDPVEYSRLLAGSMRDTEAQLSSAEAALADARLLLVPALESLQLTRHPLLAMALGHSRTAVLQLECLAEDLKGRLKQCSAAQGRTKWMALPSVVSWVGNSQSRSRAAKAKLRAGVELACLVIEAADFLGAPKVASKMCDRIASAVAACDDVSDVRQALTGAASDVIGKSSLPVSSDEERKMDSTLNALCGGWSPTGTLPQSAIAAARAVLMGTGLLSSLHDRWRAVIAGALLDNGWRCVTEKAGGQRSGGGEVTYLLHTRSKAVLEVPHMCRTACFRFRSSGSSKPHRCDAWGRIEADHFEHPDHAVKLDESGVDERWPPLRTGGGPVGASMLGDWALAYDKGRVVLSTAGANLYVTREGGAVFVPARERGVSEALVIEGGWARRVPRVLALESLFLISKAV